MARILVVEDSESCAEFTRAALAPLHDVDIARNGREASKLAWQSHYDLIITDIFMPEGDGFETMRDMRRALPKVPIIAMSGSPAGSPDYLRIAANLGASDTIRKPFRPSDLKRAVDAQLGGQN